MASKLTALLAPSAADTAGASQDFGTHASSLYSAFKQEAALYNSDAPARSKIPSLAVLGSHLDRQCSTVFKQIAEAQKRNILFGTPLCLGPGHRQDATDMRMLYEVSP